MSRRLRPPDDLPVECTATRKLDTSKTFAKRLSVSRELIEGLVLSHQIEGEVHEGKSGGRVVMVYRDQARALLERMSKLQSS